MGNIFLDFTISTIPIKLTETGQTDSIMNMAITDNIQEVVEYQYPFISLDDLLTPSLINELFVNRNTRYRQFSLVDSLSALFGYGLASDDNKAKAIERLQTDIADLKTFARTTH